MDEKDRQEPFSEFGKPGDPVAEVDADDLKAVWQLMNDREAGSAGERAIGFMVFEAVCKPGADIQAVFYRAGMLSLLTQDAPDGPTLCMKEGQLDLAVFRVVASIPMEWMGVGIVRHGSPFDIDEFFRRLREDL